MLISNSIKDGINSNDKVLEILKKTPNTMA